MKDGVIDYLYFYEYEAILKKGSGIDIILFLCYKNNSKGGLRMDPNVRSNKAREHSVSVLVLRVKNDVLQFLAVKIWGDKKRGRAGRFGPNDRGQVPMWKVPTGGTESQETIEHAAARELYRETGLKADLFRMCLFPEFTVRKRNANHGEGEKEYHEHFLFGTFVDGLVQDITEKEEIEKAEFLTFGEALEKTGRGIKAKKDGYIDPEAFSLSQMRNFVVRPFFKIYFMTPAETEDVSRVNVVLRKWFKEFRPFIVKELDEHADELAAMKLLPEGCELNDPNPEPSENTVESIAL